MTDISSLTYEELCEFMKTLGEPEFRAKQIFEWLSKGVLSFNEMTNIPETLRTKLENIAIIATITVRKKLIDRDHTIKYLFELCDGNLIETVVMNYKHGKSVCISSQAGCRMGCRFCASTLSGKKRNLTAGEMLLQVSYVNKENHISNVVVMGVGEPLDNYDNLIIFLKNLKDENGLNISHRHVSVSTCGLVPQINTLAKENFQITLSVSLHAPDDMTRNLIMPVNKKYNIKELMTACDSYFEKTGRRISFEYILIKNINDTFTHAEKLSKLLKGKNCHVNLIPVNHVEERNFLPSDKHSANHFLETLLKNHINATMRRTLGGGINASCGQLRSSEYKEFLKQKT